tara:strand:- start:1095 stop:1328 length:234 start_codon:yes stop_codon:yes gene_type:complete
MEEEIYRAIDDLLAHKTNKTETIEKLLILFNVSNCEAEDKTETTEEYENRTGKSKSSGIPLSYFDDKMDGTPSDWGW